jgi:putative flippase GtrA
MTGRECLDDHRWQSWAGEGARYAAASAAALCVDFGAYSGLIRLGGLHYLVAAPVGFALGLATVYVLCIRWVFTRRRFADRRAEFLLFTAIGIGGLLLNQLVIYVTVDQFSLAYEQAKLVSAGIVFSFNFGLRKLLLFTRG